MQLKSTSPGLALLAFGVISVCLLASAAPRSEVHTPSLSNRLVSIQHLPDMEMCSSDLTATDLWAIQQLSPPLRPETPVQMAALQQPARPQNRPAATAAAPVANRTLKPERTIRDADPTYSAIGLDLLHDEIILQDNNLWSTRVFKRTDNTPVGQKLTEEQRVIAGDKTEIQFNHGIYIDPKY